MSFQGLGLNLRDIPRINGTTVKGGPDDCKSPESEQNFIWVDTLMDPVHKNGKTKSHSLK